jgi:hypothetical protein
MSECDFMVSEVGEFLRTVTDIVAIGQQRLTSDGQLGTTAFQ